MQAGRVGDFRRGWAWGAGLAAAVWLALAPGCGAPPAVGGDGGLNAVPIAAVAPSRVGNLHRLAAKVYAGAQPEGEAAYAELATRGIRTVISVDGATPDQATAAKFGLRYIHLPIGYDGVPVATQRALAKAIVEADGAVYIHCHHGKHRGAAAAAAACVVAGLIDEAHALAALKQMQTGANYAGLWQDVREAQPVAVSELRALQVEYKAAQPIPALAQSMVRIDAIHDRLQECKTAGWPGRGQQPDPSPAHAALLLEEQFAEIRRTPECAARPPEFQAWAQAAEQAAATLENNLRAGGPVVESNAAWERLQASCLDCHAKYRNLPAGK